MKYLLPIPDLLSHDSMVDSEDLAIALGHQNEDAATELLELRDPHNGAGYVLRLCGAVTIRDAHGQMHHGRDLDVARFRELRGAGGEFLTNPWFEWIRNSGDTLLEPDDSIYTDPAEEICCLAEALGIDAQRLMVVGVPA